MLIREYVARLSDAEKIAIINSYEKFECDGHIGNEPIRIHAEHIVDSIGASNVMITLWMKELAVECYRAFTQKYFELASSGP